jgi:hypothetical protein
MFGLPIELILTIGSGIGGFIMKNIAQNRANQYNILKLSMESDKLHSSLADSANKRGTPVARKAIAFTIIGVVFVGTLVLAFFNSIETTLVLDKAQKSFLGFKWGRTYDTIRTNGFMIVPWFKYCVITVVSFYMGTGASKIT